MANRTPNGPFAIRHRGGIPAGTKPACPGEALGSTPPIAPCQASKRLKTLKTARASYWLKLAWILVRRDVRLARWCRPLLNWDTRGARWKLTETGKFGRVTVSWTFHHKSVPRVDHDVVRSATSGRVRLPT